MAQSETVSEEQKAHWLSQWTDEQEIALLKAIVKYKPCGLQIQIRKVGLS